jgi:putative phosphoesterase
MTKIVILSDTHSYLHQGIFDFFSNCDQIWHAGDIGNIQIAETLNQLKPLKAVYGNIDGSDVRITYPKTLSFYCEDVKVLMTHIGGYPYRYDKTVIPLLTQEKPDLFICGHSHILKVMFDKKYNFLYINPGAAGKYGFHKFITYIRFTIDGKNMKDLEVYEFDRNMTIIK